MLQYTAMKLVIVFIICMGKVKLVVKVSEVPQFTCTQRI